jgi:hypothetical protein
MIARATIRQIAEAVEKQGGDMGDVRDLVECWERLHAGLAAANVRFAEGDHAGAESVWAELEAEYGKPLDQVVREQRQERR